LAQLDARIDAAALRLSQVTVAKGTVSDHGSCLSGTEFAGSASASYNDHIFSAASWVYLDFSPAMSFSMDAYAQYAGPGGTGYTENSSHVFGTSVNTFLQAPYNTLVCTGQAYTAVSCGQYPGGPGLWLFTSTWNPSTACSSILPVKK
jgi:hypothetical protein